MKKIYGRATALALALCMLFSGCGGREPSLSPENPVTITVWHYYNGDQQKAFDEMVKEFNATVGTEKGVLVESQSQGDVNQLEERVLAAAKGEVGSEAMPDVFASYADNAYAIDRMGLLTDLDQYLTKEEQEAYWPSYIEEGRIGEHGELKIFPTAKSTEVLMLNKTAFDKFSAATGVTVDDLATKEGLVRAAKTYYEWTDAQTPDIPNDGKAFYGRDALANLFIIGGMQLGTELFHVENGTAAFHIDKNVMRRIWDVYYVPMVNGWFYEGGKFRSDDLRVGDIIAYTGSTSSATYFPPEVTEGEQVTSIDLLVLPVPVFEGGTPYAV
ncbi:MAG: extracellular solute-binding protein, partial [Oscillospiraceae bacterium]|nr:extracellular solute-binding protein [Oscillospiraceae bacterium]